MMEINEPKRKDCYQVFFAVVTDQKIGGKINNRKEILEHLMMKLRKKESSTFGIKLDVTTIS